MGRGECHSQIIVGTAKFGLFSEHYGFTPCGMCSRLHGAHAMAYMTMWAVLWALLEFVLCGLCRGHFGDCAVWIALWELAWIVEGVLTAWPTTCNPWKAPRPEQSSHSTALKVAQ